MSIRLEILAPFDSFSRKKYIFILGLQMKCEAYNLFFGENIYHCHGLQVPNGVEDTRCIWSTC